MGATRGNQNALKHGQRCRNGLTIGASGKGTGYVSVALRQLRTALEAAVADAHGEIDLTRSALINSACRWERVAQLSTRWLKLEEKLPVGDRLNLVRGIAQASDARDKCIKALAIDVKPTDLWATLHAPPATNQPQQAAERTEATEATDDAA